MIRHERCRSAGMLSLFSSRHTIKAIFALGLLGVVIAFHQLLLSDHGYNVGTTSFRNGTGSISSVNFFRIWHPPWTRTEKNSQATKFNPEGPECSRTLLYRFAGAHGFASEYLIFLRVVLLAKHFRYEVIIDDSQWNYGRWTDYFTPTALSCHMPYGYKNLDRTPLAPAAGDPPLAFIRMKDMWPSWTQAAHVVWSTRKLDYLDQMILDLYTNATQVEDLHLQDRKPSETHVPLTTSETLPAVYRAAFDVMSQTVSQLWSLNSEMRQLVDSTLSTFAYVSGKRGPIIAAHVRLGDKALELHKFGPGALPKSRKTLQQLYDLWDKRMGTKNQYKRSVYGHPLGAASIPELPSSSMHRHLAGSQNSPNKLSSVANQDAYVVAAQGLADEVSKRRSDHDLRTDTPLLLVISDDASGAGLGGIIHHKAIAAFRLFVGLDSLVLGEEVKADGQQGIATSYSTSVPEVPSLQGFYEGEFNASPMPQRVANTRLFLRDLTAAARLADGLVLTGSSNVGRLLALLNAQSRNPDKLFRSVDVRWFPTSRYQ